MPHPNAFSPSWFEGPEFFAKIIGLFNNFLPKKYEGFRSSVVEHKVHQEGRKNCIMKLECLIV